MIDYELVGEAINWYQYQFQHVNGGFKYVEAPWLIESEAMLVTLPKDKYGICTTYCNEDTKQAKYLPGSAEQSFIQMMLDNTLPNGQYCAAGPCFRDEVEDELHSTTFFKVELIIVGSNKKEDLDWLVKVASSFFNSRSNVEEDNGKFEVDVEKTEDGFDLLLNGIEIGSYGMRSYKNYKWIYGTGLALPRFNKAIKSLNSLI